MNRRMTPYRLLISEGGIALALLCGSATLRSSAAQEEPSTSQQAPFTVERAPAGAQDTTPPIKPPPVPTGVIPLPQGVPPTAQQARVPAPAQPLPRADRPLTVSPALKAVDGYAERHALTLQETVAVALYTSRDLAAAVAALQQAQARTGQARAALNPTLALSAQATEYDSATSANLGALPGSTGQGSGSAQSLLLTPQFDPNLTAALTLPLDVAGMLQAAVSQAQFQEVAARIDVNRVRNDLVYNVKTAFYNVLRAQAQIGVATDTLDNSLLSLSDANQRYQAGTTARYDVISAQRDVANAQQGLIQARAQFSINSAALKNTMGISQQTRLRLADTNAVEPPPGVQPPTMALTGPPSKPNVPADTTTLQTPAPQPAAPLIPNPAAPRASGGEMPPPLSPAGGEVEDTFAFGPEYEALRQEALRNRPEVLEGDAQIAAARRGIQYARRSSLPALTLALSDTYTPNSTGFTRQNVGAATLGLSFPVFDGGLTRERTREARGILAGAEISRRQAVDTVQVDVQQAYIVVVQARNRVAVANVELARACESYRLARVRYAAGVSQQAGVSPLLELSNAQTTLSQAQSDQINALYDYNNARAQVDRAAGRYSFTGSGPGYPDPPAPGVRGISPK